MKHELLDDAVDVLRAVSIFFEHTDSPLGNAARDVIRRYEAELPMPGIDDLEDEQ